MAMSKEKAAQIYTGQKKINDFAALQEIETYFFLDNNFNFDESGSYECDLPHRHFIFNIEKTKYYCSPTPQNNIFRIRDCDKITNVELYTDDAGSNALTGALLFGTAGAIVGNSSKKSVLKIKLNTSDINEPIVILDILYVPTTSQNKLFIKSFEAANKIFGQLKAIAEKNINASPQNNSNSLSVSDEIRKLKDLLDEGILTQEEFDNQKKRLLGM